MRNFRGFLAASLAVFTVAAPGFAAQKATCYSTWDDRFLYIACEVQDPDIVSVNTTHMSQPWNDDSIEVFVDKDLSCAANRVPGTYQMSVSAGGGSSWLIGNGSQAVQRKIYSFKYASKAQGTVNKSDDADIGYVVEMALPWSEMGGIPKTGTTIGFNLLWRSKGEREGFVSFSPNVKAESETQIPAKWAKMELVTSASAPVVDGVLKCAAVKDKSPVVDGTLSADEYDRAMGVQLTQPETPLSTAAASAQPGQTVSKHLPIEKLVLATYHVDYQGEMRKGSSPSESLWGADGSSTLVDHPLDAPGPWYSGDRIQWEKGQLAGASHAGIDVLLVSIKADADAHSLSEALSALVQGMRELKTEKRNCPLVALRLDFGGKPTTKEAMYDSISGFLKRVPDEFLASIRVPVEKGGSSSYIVEVENWDKSTDWSAAKQYCDSRVSSDFGGHLIWISSQQNDLLDSSWIRTSEISPVSSSARSDIGAYTTSWTDVLSKPADWLIVRSWNDLRGGTEICPTMEYGDRYLDVARIGIVEWNGKQPWHAKFLRQNTPAVMAPGGMYQVTFAIKNAGRKPWYTEDGVFLAGRWYKDGFLYADSGARVPMQETVLASQTLTKTISVFAVDQNHKPLVPGDYELRWEMVRGSNEWFSGNGDLPLIVPVKIGDVSPGFTLVSSTLPARMKPGVAYTAHVKVRNDGSSPWKAGDAKIGYRFGSTGDFTVGSPLISDAEAGRVAEIIASVSLPSATEVGATSRIQWGIFDGKSWVVPSSGDAGDPVQAVSDDLRVKFIATDTAKSMSAGTKYGADLVIENASPNTWKKGDLCIGYHWYRLDGTEAVWDGDKTPISDEVLPGGRVLVKATITPPDYDGEYYLVWDVWSSNKWISTSADTCGGSSLVVPVSVGQGKLVSVSLDSLYNDVATKDSAELIPSLVTNSPRSSTLWPTELWVQPTSGGVASVKRVSFDYPLRVSGAKNAIVCKGQSIGIKSASCKAVHILAVADSDTSAEFSLDCSGVRTTSALQMSGCTTSPKQGEVAAFKSQRLEKDYYIKHYVLAANPSSPLTGIILPDNPAVKILAITLEKADK